MSLCLVTVQKCQCKEISHLVGDVGFLFIGIFVKSECCHVFKDGRPYVTVQSFLIAEDILQNQSSFIRESHIPW